MPKYDKVATERSREGKTPMFKKTAAQGGLRPEIMCTSSESTENDEIMPLRIPCAAGLYVPPNDEP